MSFREYLVGEGLHPSTIRLYVAHTERAEEWMTQHLTTLAWCSPSHVAEYAHTLAAGYSTRRQASVAFTHYWEWKERKSPPVKALRVPPAPEMECKALPPDQARDLVKVALGWWPQGTAVLMGLYLALRRTEIARAEWGRFSPDFDWYTCHGKFDKTRVLPVHPVLKAEVAEWVGEGWMFSGRWGGPSHPNTVWQWTKEVAREAGIDDLRTHQLRHTALAQANDVTGNLRAVQSFAGHSKVSTTAGYTRTTKSRLREVSDSLDYL